MKFTRCEIPDVLLIEPDVHEDARGFFLESYHKALFFENGVRVEFVQENHSRSARGVLRGLHYQLAPAAQHKLVRVTNGEAFDVAVDLREGSKTFGKHVAQKLSAENRKMIYIPAGFAHGFLALKDNTEFFYKVSEYYAPKLERGILWSDPALRISWPAVPGGPIVSEKDKKHPPLASAALD